MAALDTKPVVGAGGGVYVAPVATTLPSTVTALESSPYTYLGLISEDGLSWTPPEEETEEIKVWQLQFPWDVVTTGLSSSFSFSLAQWNRDTLGFALGGTGTFTNEPTTTPTHVYYEPPLIGAAADERQVALRVKTSSGHDMAVVFPRAKVTERQEITFQKGEASLLGVTVTMLGDEEVAPYRLIFDAASLPAS